MNSIRLLFDGYSLIYAPFSPPALHLMMLVELAPPLVERVIALPGKPDGWLDEWIQSRPSLRLEIELVEDSPSGALRWEQSILPGLRKRSAARYAILTRSGVSLTGAPFAFVSPAEPLNQRLPAPVAFTARLRESLAQGGLRRIGGVLYPDDLPVLTDLPERAARISLPAAVPEGFRTGDSLPLHEDTLDLPESYVLYHSQGSGTALELALKSWTWAAGPVGETFPLVCAGLSEEEERQLLDSTGAMGLGDTVRVLKLNNPGQLSAVYQGASLVFHPAEGSPWNGPVRLGLAAGKPVVSVQTRLNHELVGAAGYLVPAGDSRGLGAAVITALVQENVSEQLKQAALVRSAAWHIHAFQQEWANWCQSLAKQLT